MGATVRTHLILELLPCLVDLVTALGWQTAAAVTLFALLTHRPQRDAPRPATRPSTALCVTTLVLLMIITIS